MNNIKTWAAGTALALAAGLLPQVPLADTEVGQGDLA